MSAVGRLALGSAQWGMPYGVANRTGPPSPDELAALLDTARDAGIHTLDTARAYGESESRIGAAAGGDAHWTIVTKLDPDAGAAQLGRAAGLRRVDESVDRSRQALRRERLDVLLLHRGFHRHAWGGALWERLQARRDAGHIGRLGASAESPAEAWALLEDPSVEVLQVAASLLDQRLARRGFFQRAERLGKTVYVRSAFLQGAALLPVDALPDALRGLAPALRRVDAWATARDLARVDALLLYLRELPAPVVLGCETPGQLRHNLAAWRGPAARHEALAALADAIGPLPVDLIDPSRWPERAPQVPKASAISRCSASAAAQGSGALRMGRPTTT